MGKQFTIIRLILAVLGTGAQEVAIWAVWMYVLPDFGIYLPLLPMIIVMVVWGGLDTWIFIFTTNILKKSAQIGQTSMLGAVGVIVSALKREGMVKIRGELWRAVAEKGEIDIGEEVVVVGEKGLKLTVRRVERAKR